MTEAARAAAGRLPHEPGVYRFLDAGGRTLYVGRAVDLRRRVRSYWRGTGDRPHLRVMVARIARVQALVCASEHEAAWLERNLLERRRPRWNRTAGGEEVPVHLHLERSPATPGLRITHAPGPAPCFGPYLGGLRARTVVAALERLYPLRYTGSRLSPAERDMAARLGVGPQDREALADGVRAVLDREPAAVAGALADLTRRRDAATAALAYERAAALQDGIAALAWATAPQRVTTLEPLDADVAGWAPGVRVRLQVRGGRMCGWEQRRGGAGDAGEDTPPGLAGFALRNAELAAELAVAQ